MSDGAAVSEILNESYEKEYGSVDTVPEVADVKQTTDEWSQAEILNKYTNLLLQGSQDSALGASLYEIVEFVTEQSKVNKSR